MNERENIPDQSNVPKMLESTTNIFFFFGPIQSHFLSFDCHLDISEGKKSKDEEKITISFSCKSNDYFSLIKHL